jgi:hypothetical protein
MPDWPAIDTAVNVIMQQTFGEPVVYQSVQAGQPVGDPSQRTAIRHSRVHDEVGATANFEEISVIPSDFASPPAKGDWVTAWGAQYVVTTVRQPDAYGMLTLSLLQRS